MRLVVTAGRQRVWVGLEPESAEGHGRCATESEGHRVRQRAYRQGSRRLAPGAGSR